MLIDKDLRLSISGCFWLFYASKYNGVKNVMYPLWGIVTINCINPCVDEY